MSQREPTEEELRAAFEEEMRRVSVQDVVVQTLVTLVNMGGRRLGLGPPGEENEGQKDLAQAQLAIEAIRALLPLTPTEATTPIRNALAQLQVAYSRETQAAGAGGEASSTGPTPPSGEESPAGGQGERPGPARPAADEAERAKARSKIWTPPGA